MTDVKPTAVGQMRGNGSSRTTLPARVASKPAMQSTRQGAEQPSPKSPSSRDSNARDPIAAFIAPVPETSDWLHDPRLAATLKAASESLAPSGIAENAADRYAASVIETHLAARARLSKLTNALLKT